MRRISWVKWKQVDGPTEDHSNGTYTDCMRVPGGWILKVEEWGSGGVRGELLNRCLVFIPHSDSLPKKEEPRG